MHDETPADLARILSFAATYMEERGRARYRFGGSAGGPLCPAAAIALALGLSPKRIGWRSFFFPLNKTQRAVGAVILRTRLLDDLPVPANSHGRRKLRPARMSAHRAVRELARWSDDKALDRLVVIALRQEARRLVTQHHSKSATRVAA